MAWASVMGESQHDISPGENPKQACPNTMKRWSNRSSTRRLRLQRAVRAHGETAMKTSTLAAGSSASDEDRSERCRGGGGAAVSGGGLRGETLAWARRREGNQRALRRGRDVGATEMLTNRLIEPKSDSILSQFPQLKQLKHGCRYQTSPWGVGQKGIQAQSAL